MKTIRPPSFGGLTLCAIVLALWTFGENLHAAGPVADVERLGVPEAATPKPSSRVKMRPELRSSKSSEEFNADYSYIGDAKVRKDGVSFGNVSEQHGSLRYVHSQQLNDSLIFRAGVASEQFAFGTPANAPLPNTLRSVNAVIGADMVLSDRWLLRAEIEPGVYSDFADISFDDLNAPLTLGGSYLVDKDLQWFFGLSVDARRSVPVLPGGGVRWKFAEQWTLMFLPPEPRLEYEINEATTLYLGASLKGATYKVARNFGDTHGQPNLNNATLDYFEVRLGVGAAWKASPTFTVEVESGYMPYREFDFHSANDKVKGSGAPYGQVALKASF